MAAAPAGRAHELTRRLGVGDAVVIGLGAMLGAGVFAAFAPAARAAGAWLPAGLAVAAIVAACNATSTARLAARHPSSGGVYVYGRERLGPFWGYLAGWTFVVGKTASCAAMALTFAAYAVPDHQLLAAVTAVLALTALNWRGVHKSAQVTRVIVAVVLGVLVAVVAAGAVATPPSVGLLTPADPFPALGVLEAGGLLFFAFAGYARVATLGEEVRDPAHTIPRAVRTALLVVLVVYAAVGVTALGVLGPERLADATAPLAEVVTAAGAGWLAPVVRVGAALAALGSLLALILGVSRTSFAMARDRYLPAALDAVHPRHHVPHRAELAVGLVVATLAATVDLRGAIGFSSFGVLLYYAIANAAALTLTRAQARPARVVPVVGLAGCLLLAAALPTASVVAGVIVVAIGAASYVRVSARRGRRL
ncbi:APC family permease [Pilimelia columellifera]|uniref:Amino acid permease n=1 Tax=Pilimelia columellifera subsp. columellifera TaxID=706583 RepID=A0ABN3N856_9ACTN